MGQKIYLFRFSFRGIRYHYTNANFDIITVMTYTGITNSSVTLNPSIVNGTVFSSINIEITSPFILDGSVNDNPITINVDNIAPFNIISLLDKTIDIEIFELNGTQLIGKYKGEVAKQKLGANYQLTTAGRKNRFKNNIPVLTTSPLCPLATYGTLCSIATTLHFKDIVVLTTSERFVVFNISDHAAWTTRQQYLDTNNLGNAFDGGYITQNNLFITVEQQTRLSYAATTGTSTTLINISCSEPLIIDQELEFYNGTSFVTYAKIQAIQTIDPNYQVLTVDHSSSSINQVVINYLLTKANAKFDGYGSGTHAIGIGGGANVVEGDNHSYAHCNLKFLNASRFLGEINMPDRNPAVSPVIRPQRIRNPQAVAING